MPFDNNSIYIYGDSGSPAMIPTTNGLVFIWGATTSGLSTDMEADMVTLIQNYNSERGYNPGDSRYLDPNNPDYQLRSY